MQTLLNLLILRSDHWVNIWLELCTWPVLGKVNYSLYSWKRYVNEHWIRISGRCEISITRKSKMILTRNIGTYQVRVNTATRSPGWDPNEGKWWGYSTRKWLSQGISSNLIKQDQKEKEHKYKHIHVTERQPELLGMPPALKQKHAAHRSGGSTTMVASDWDHHGRNGNREAHARQHKGGSSNNTTAVRWRCGWQQQ